MNENPYKTQKTKLLLYLGCTHGITAVLKAETDTSDNICRELS